MTGGMGPTSRSLRIYSRQFRRIPGTVLGGAIGVRSCSATAGAGRTARTRQRTKTLVIIGRVGDSRPAGEMPIYGMLGLLRRRPRVRVPSTPPTFTRKSVRVETTARCSGLLLHLSQSDPFVFSVAPGVAPILDR